jgi:Fic family protein
MLDDNWELINGPVAHEIEVLNYANQVNVIEALIRFVVHHEGTGPTGTPKPLNCNALRELHRTGTLLLLESPGEYRTTPVHVERADGTIVYEAPPVGEVAALMEDFERGIAALWTTADPIHIAALTLWRLNWIHPFKNGNGRTARAFSYACLCMKFGFVLPGTPTVIDQIMVSRPDYNAALRHADLTLEANGSPDLGPMKELIERLLTEQLSSIPAAGDAPQAKPEDAPEEHP